MRGGRPRTLPVLLVVLGVAALAGCAGGDVDAPDVPSAVTTTSDAQPDGADADATDADGSGGDGAGGDGAGVEGAGQDGAVEERPAPPIEETDGPEDPVAGGGGGVSVELAGLPVGGGEALDLGGTWCQVLFWRSSLPDGVRLDIRSVHLEQAGATVLPDGCGDVPPCAGSSVSGEDIGGCSVAVSPPSPDTALVTARLDGTLWCPDQEACDAVGATGGSTVAILNPVPGAAGEGGSGDTSGDGVGEDGAGEDGAGEDGAGADGVTEDGTDDGDGADGPGTDAGPGEDAGTASTSPAD